MNRVEDYEKNFNPFKLLESAEMILRNFLLYNSRNELYRIKHLIYPNIYNHYANSGVAVNDRIQYNNLEIENKTLVFQVAKDGVYIANITVDIISTDNNNVQRKEKFLLTMKRDIDVFPKRKDYRCIECNSVVNTLGSDFCKKCGVLFRLDANGWMLYSIDKVEIIGKEKKSYLWLTFLVIALIGVLVYLYIDPIIDFIVKANLLIYVLVALGVGVVFSVVVSLVLKLIANAKKKKVDYYAVKNILGIIPEYTKGSFEGSLYKLYENSQIMLSNQDIDNLKRCITRRLYEKYAPNLINYKKKNIQYVVNDMRLRDFEIMDVNIVNNQRMVTVYTNVSFMGYIINKNTNKIIDGSNTYRSNFCYELTFVNIGNIWVLSSEKTISGYYNVGNI